MASYSARVGERLEGRKAWPQGGHEVAGATVSKRLRNTILANNPTGPEEKESAFALQQRTLNGPETIHSGMSHPGILHLEHLFDEKNVFFCTLGVCNFCHKPI